MKANRGGGARGARAAGALAVASLATWVMTAGALTGCSDDPCDRYCAAIEKADCPEDQDLIDDCDQACDFGRDFLEACADQYDALIGCQGDQTYECDEFGQGQPPAGSCTEENEAFSACFFGGSAQSFEK